MTLLPHRNFERSTMWSFPLVLLLSVPLFGDLTSHSVMGKGKNNALSRHVHFIAMSSSDGVRKKNALGDATGCLGCNKGVFESENS